MQARTDCCRILTPGQAHRRESRVIDLLGVTGSERQIGRSFLLEILVYNLLLTHIVTFEMCVNLEIFFEECSVDEKALSNKKPHGIIIIKPQGTGSPRPDGI